MSGRDVRALALAEFCAAPFDMVEDVCGDPAAGLAVLMAGNQFMVMPDLVAGFLAQRPQAGSVFYETLPPGVIAEQFRRGGLRLGSLELRVRADVVALSPEAIAGLHAAGLTGPGRDYASNDLALLVAAGNPAGISGLADLGRPDLRVAIPDPRAEGIGELALRALERAGGTELRRSVEEVKRQAGTAVFTSIHHRQSPAWIKDGQIDAAVVWSTEAGYHLARGEEFGLVPIPAEHNLTGGYAAAVAAGAPHPAHAQAFVDYLCGDAGQACYAGHGFGKPA